jgi:SAM-dependent methyltransferase
VENIPNHRGAHHDHHIRSRPHKDTTRAQWQDAAGAWHGWGATLEDWLGEATNLMLDTAGITTGCTVLDVAAGAGGQSLTAARRVGAEGSVLATDISPAILEYAAAAATAAGLTNLQTRELDGERLDVDAAAFDAVISRLGLIYFPDRARALAGQYRALRPGGRVSAIVYSTADRNEFFSIPVSIIRRRAQLPRRPPASLDRSALAVPTSWPTPSARPAFAMSDRRRLPHPCGWPAQPNASGSSASRSVRCTRC